MCWNTICPQAGAFLLVFWSDCAAECTAVLVTSFTVLWLAFINSSRIVVSGDTLLLLQHAQHRVSLDLVCFSALSK